MNCGTIGRIHYSDGIASSENFGGQSTSNFLSVNTLKFGFLPDAIESSPLAIATGKLTG
jgi:hypothetical protein